MIRQTTRVFIAAMMAASAVAAHAETLNVIDVADPAFNQVFRTTPWMSIVLEPLAMKNPKTLEPMPVLAKDWEVDSDFTKITFHLKQGVTFHDGKPMTAANVAFGLEQAQKPENNSKALSIAQRITSIETPDDFTVVVTFTGPTANMWDLFYETPVLDPDTFANIADGSVVNGTGAFAFGDWAPGSQFSLEKFDDYRDADEVYYDAMNVLIIGDPSAQQAALRSGRAQMAYGITARDAGTLQSAGYAVLPGRPMTVGMAMNVSIPPFDNPLARQAVGYAVDRDRLIAQANAGIGNATDLWWVADANWSDEQAKDLLGRYSYDPERARALVEEAGVAGAHVPLIFPTNPVYLSYYNIIADGLRAAGFEPEAVQLETNEAVSRLLRGDLGEAYLYYDSTTVQSPFAVAADTPIFRTGDIGPQKYESDKYSALLAALETATASTYSGALADLTDFVLDEAFNHAFVTVPTPVVVSNKVEVIDDVSALPAFNVHGSLTGLGIRPVAQ